MLSGKPVLASVDEDSATHRLIVDNQCGISVAPGNKDELVRAMRDLSGKTVEELKEMGKNSRDYAMTHLTRDVNLALVVNKIHNILN